jgi:hypothetical protein
MVKHLNNEPFINHPQTQSKREGSSCAYIVRSDLTK